MEIECPVCLEGYNERSSIPRVLQCGHTCCETCLSNLHNNNNKTSILRCPCCTQLIPFPSLGPTSLPKNIDLLRISLTYTDTPTPTPTPTQTRRRITLNPLCHWTHHHHLLYSSWKDWILPYDAVSHHPTPAKSSLLPIARFHLHYPAFHYTYTAKIITLLAQITHSFRHEIKSILALSSTNSRVSNLLGLWLSHNHLLYLVTSKLTLHPIFHFAHFSACPNLGPFGLELCQAFMTLHSQGVICGCLALSCICFDDVANVCIDLGELFSVGGKFRECVVQGEGVEAIIGNISEMSVFVAPETALELIKRERFKEVEKNDPGCESDVWLLCCVFIRLLVGNSFFVDMYDYLRPVFRGDNEEVYRCEDMYLEWVESVKALLRPLVVSEYESVYEILIKCLDFDPKSRPLITDVWKCMKGLYVNHFGDYVPSSNSKLSEDKGYQCLLYGELCNMFNDRREESRASKLSEAQDDCKADLGLARKQGEVGDVVKGLSAGKVQCKNLQGHLDCITGFCVGGGYLFSSSFDKTVNVWSLQDLTHVHTFRGHENRVMALVFVNEEKPLCISADIGGGIFAWEISEPLAQEPLKKWFEEKDWRYSGIHALAVSESGCLYTGSGDRLIKAWLLRDSTLVCSMEGHKSVVSTLALSNGVLYSGSWDGTVRLWCLHDHSPLAVFGEDIPGTASSVLSLYADQNMMIAAHENGCMKIWVNDVLKTSTKIHDKAIFALAMEGKWLFSGGWDRVVKFQEVTVDEFEMNVIEVGSFTCDSVITALLCEQGLLFVGYANKLIKVYHCER